MSDISVLGNLDLFFFYGQNDLELENQSDLTAGLIQPKRSLFYNRRDSAGVDNRENAPIGFMQNILWRFDIAQWVAFRNAQVTDGTDGEKDRRLAVSQNSVNFKTNKNGEVDIEVTYIPFSNYKKGDTLSIPLGGI